MAIKISVDLSATFDEFVMTADEAHAMTEAVLDEVTDAFIFQWKAEAKQALRSTRNDYIRNIHKIDKGRFERMVVLMGKFNNMLEMGCSPFDMKVGFEKSNKRKITAKGGWYLTIPFRWATPDALGENEAFSGQMPPEIHDIVKGKALKAGSQSSEPIKLQDIPKALQGLGVRKAVGDFASYTHKNNIYEGIQKSTADYEKTSQNSYVSFRRVSDKSSALSWIYSGIKAYDLANRALNNLDIETIVDNTVDKFLSEIGE